MKKCKWCAEWIQDEAILCRYCQRTQVNLSLALPKTPKPRSWPEMLPPPPRPEPPSPGFVQQGIGLRGWAIAIVVPIIITLLGLTILYGILK